MKKVVFLMILCLVTQQSYCLTDQEILRGIIGSHNRALDNANMYAKPLNDQNLSDWEVAMFEVKIFIGMNTQAQRKSLLDYFTTIKQDNDKLVSGIKAIYDNKINNNRIDENIRLEFGNDFAKVLDDVRRIQKNLEWMNGSSDFENKAIKLLGVLATCVKTTAGKAIADLGFVNPNQKKQIEWIPAR